MTKQVRDWHKDMKLCEDFQRGSGWATRDLIAEQPQMPMYWLQQYAEVRDDALQLREKAAAEKERADNLEQMLDIKMKQLEQVKERADKLEEQLNHKTNLLRITDASRDEAREMYQNVIDLAHEERERADKTQAAIKEALDAWEAMDPFDDPLDTVEKMINLLRPFYPLEKEETQG